MPGLPQQLDRFAESEVCRPGQSVESVEQAAGVFHDFQCFGKLAERFDCGVAHTLGSAVGGIWS
ncbi:hypothetical protein GCM10008097_03660 [Mycetocola manganoxydans]|nr:hypothetical protein GCM10008097_03660 [Mycetocola manganoxydans]